MAKEKIIGIDLGTSNSAASVLQAGRPVIIPSAEGSSAYGKAFPSIVAFTKDNQLLVGEPARRQAISNPQGTIMAAKRKMGTNFKYSVHSKEYTAPQISGLILQKIKRDAEAFIGESITKAVITVPAYFDDNQRQATKDAGTIAGLDVVRIINEPTAAALAYGLDKSDKEHTILVFDFGGGTLDVTIMEFGQGVFEVKSTSGDTQLGGTDMDNTLINWVMKHFKEETGVDLNDDAVAVQRVREAVEKAKIELSTVMETDINLPFISATNAGPKHLQMKLTRAQLEQLVDPLIKRCKKSVDQALGDAKLSPDKIARVILVGGPTRMPAVQQSVEQWLGKDKVARGIDPMECVAMGAAIQGGVLGGEIKDILLLDVTPLSLGIETLGGVFTKLIDRNTTIPVKKSQTFSTATDNQTAVTIKIAQGERAMFTDNKVLGQFDLIGIPSAPRGIPQVEVSFDIDANGILHVTAKDLGTNKEQSMRITAPNKLDEKEVERMRKQAEDFADADKQKKEEIETVNEADTLVYSTEKTMKDFEGKVSEKELNELKEKLDSVKQALAAKERDVADLKKKMEALTEVAGKAATELYQKAAKEKGEAGMPGAEQTGPGTPEQPEVVDAEVVKEKDKKKK